jgi:hypothetical protein
MSDPKWDDKDPDDTDVFTLSWATRLGSDTIASATWLLDDEAVWPVGSGVLTKGTEGHTTTTVTVWLSGGVLDQDYELTSRVVTVGGKTLDQTVKLRVRAN